LDLPCPPKVLDYIAADAFSADAKAKRTAAIRTLI
jgi:hypothetical protein